MGLNATWQEWTAQELILDERLSGLQRYFKNFAMLGFGLAPGVGLQVIAGQAGPNVAYIDGYEVQRVNAAALVLAPNAVNHVFLKFVRTFEGGGNPPTSISAIVISFEVNTTAVQPPFSLKLGTATTDGVGVTAFTEENNKFPIHDAKLDTDLDGNGMKGRNFGAPVLPLDLVRLIDLLSTPPPDHGHTAPGDGGQLDHGLAHVPASLLDDDHPLYTLADGTRPFTGDQSHGGNKITSLAPGVLANDGVNVSQLQAALAGLSWKQAVVAGSVGDLTLAVMPAAVDTIVLALLDRFLVKDQTLPEENGIYEFNGVGVAATRTTDCDTALELEGAAVFVEEGATNPNTAWTQTSDNFVLGVGAVVWAQFDAGSIAAGGGLTKTGNTLDVGAGPGIIVNADDVEVIYGTDVEDVTSGPESAGVLDEASRADHVHNHGDLPLGDGLDHALVTPNPGGVAGFMSPADKKILDDLNPGAAGFCWGKTIFVDAECGDDATGTRNDASRPFLTLAAAAVATGIVPGDIIFVRPGAYSLAADFTIPIGVTIHGMDKARVTIQRLLAVVPATLITMSVDSALFDVTLRLTGGSNLATLLRGVNFPGATGSTARLKNVAVEVDNGGVVAVVDSTEVIGVRVGSTGTPSKYHASMEDVEILVVTKGNGKKRCVLLESSGGTVNARNVDSLLERQGAAPGAPNYIAVEIDQVSATLYLQDGSSEVSPATAGADVSQTNGELQLQSHLLVTNNANGKGFTAFNSHDEDNWSGEGTVPSSATNYLVPGFGAVRPLATRVFKRIAENEVCVGMSVRVRSHPGIPGNHPFVVTIQKGGVNTGITLSVPDGTTSIDFTGNVSVSFARGDDLSIEVVTDTSVPVDLIVTPRMY